MTATAASSAAASIADPAHTEPTSDANGMSPFEVFQRVGLLTRKLHDALRELGYSAAVESAVSSLPDARARLSYIATVTGRAADRVLTAAEAGREIQSGVERDARALAARLGGKRGLVSARTAVRRRELAAAQQLLEQLARSASRTNEQFSEIILAQDFHDLTGQVITRVVTLAQTLEEQLVKLLLDVSPPEQRPKAADTETLAGPVIDAVGRTDVVTDQSQVDDLLASLGF